jgi:hypothetical protein
VGEGHKNFSSNVGNGRDRSLHNGVIYDIFPDLI